jgi:hypothetical protein
VETGSNVEVSFNPSKSLNCLTHGMQSFTHPSLTYTRNTNTTGFIYFNFISVSFEWSTVEPKWHQFLHGWYDSGNDNRRAVVFIDSSATVGNRMTVMDSFNSLFLWKQQIPNTGGTLIYEASSGDAGKLINFVVQPGKYRIEAKAGNGGAGGSGGTGPIPGGDAGGDGYQGIPNTGYSGGAGVIGESSIIKVVYLTNYTLGLQRGRDGGNGGNSVVRMALSGMNEYGWAFSGGGGGCSGEDTLVTVNGVVQFRVYGGAGGGGCTGGDWGDRKAYRDVDCISGAGGGGAGYGIGGNGTGNTIPGLQLFGSGGTMSSGGRAGVRNANPETYATGRCSNGIPGENISSSVFYRRGGNSPEAWTLALRVTPVGAGYATGGTVQGGNITSASSGYLRVYRID